MTSKSVATPRIMSTDRHQFVLNLTDIEGGPCRLKNLKIYLMSVKVMPIIGHIRNYYQFLRRNAHIFNRSTSNNDNYNRHTLPLKYNAVRFVRLLPKPPLPKAKAI